ncbi:MAG: putative manganese-dependent inorganic diphosphatase [Bacilli bacterium]|nr:putative manganese-dependent inorganic diphosphatase [Bacilli bacterium]
MIKKDTIYIFGHRNPDTDSVTSAIALSYLRKRQGLECEPAVLSSLNLETNYVLNYFNVEEPVFLNDVKVKISDLDFEKKYSVTEDDSLNDAYFKMLDAEISKIPVVDKYKRLKGLITMKDIAHEQFTNSIDMVKSTYDNILAAINGEELLRFDDKIEGNLLVASYKTSTIKENVEFNSKHILVVGDRHDIIKYAIKSRVKMLIITGPNTITERNLQLARKNKVNIINTKYDTMMTSRRFYLANNLSTIPYKKEILSIHDYDNVSDFMNLANKTRYNYYPVLNEKEKCVGILKLSDVNYDNRQRVILVDHNNYEQSAIGLDEAEILEIIDHHNIGSIGTNMPINFRNMPVGSTNTILYVMYNENNVKIPKKIAGLMLSGILSDTLILTSPTTTKLDKKAVKELSEKAGVDYKEYGYNMLRAGSSLRGKTKEEILYTDYKSYPVGDVKIGLGQISTTNPDEILKKKDEYINLLNAVSEGNNYYFVCFFITDVINKGSYVLYSERAEEILKKAYKDDELVQGTFLKGIVSRKKQILPVIMLEMG